MKVIKPEGVDDYPSATRYATDEHGDLEVFTGSDGDRPLHLYKRDRWLEVDVDGG